MFYKKLSSLTVSFIVACFLSSCSVTTAPTDASSGTTGQTTDASSDLTSSTTQDDEDDGDEKDDEEVEEFVTANFSQLRSNMSVGRGEYLASLAALLVVDDGDKEQFYAMTKNNFTRLFISSQTTPKELVINLKQELAESKI